ncbi:MAG: 2-C-methyl-D-erythritol 2,4-cyclodiphosphate synthase, partial [Ignavibacteriae bacterium]|nr:2-C-methyl-D-erythritol 2,4-cyclodiphosphate synthase [Ignavibacteriota bacterium]
KNISSLILLGEVYKLISKKKWIVGNVDSMILLEEPKVYPFIPEMKKNISKILKTANISVKATTSEGLGFVGRKQGCSANAVVLLYK